MTQENPFWPRQISTQELLLNAFSSLVAGILWSIIIILTLFLFGQVFWISESIASSELWNPSTNMFAFILSIIAFLGTSISVFLNYKFINLVNPERYKSNTIIYAQMAFFCVFSYIFITPLYIYAWVVSYENIMFVFLGHTILISFGTSIISEVLNNYRYVLTGIYGSFLGLFLSFIFTIFIFLSFSSGYARLLALLFLLPLIMTAMTFFKQVFELLYYKYNRFSNLDQLGDIFYQIELEEKERMKEQTQKEML